MKKRKPGRLRPSAAIVIMFAASVFLLLFGSIGGARAALTYYSDTYSSQVRLYDIGVSLLENDRTVSYRNYNSRKADGTWNEEKGVLLDGLLVDKATGEKEYIEPGREYEMNLRAQNSGNIDEYVRVTIYKYWLEKGSLDENGKKTKNWEKRQDLDPSLIRLNFINEKYWIEDEAARTPERTVLYYNRPLGEGRKTEAFVDALMIDGSIADKATQTQSTQNGYTEFVTTYEYDGAQFWLEVEVDAVQEHNVEDAIWSAWGRRVNISRSGTLSLRRQ